MKKVQEYYTQARHRAKRRKSAWNLLLIPAVTVPLIFIYLACLTMVELAHIKMFPGETLKNANSLGVILATVAPLFAALPFSMIVGNFIVWLVPPARRIFESEAKGFPGASFGNTQKKLLKWGLIVLVVSVVVTVIGIRMAWVV